MEGSLAPIACLDAPENLCDHAAECEVLPFWKGLDHVINEYVDSYTLQDLLDQANDLVGNDYSI